MVQSGALAEAGEGLKVGQLTPIAATLSRRMEHEVLHPMDQWLKLHAVRPHLLECLLQATQACVGR